MSFGGSVLAMIITLKNNARHRRKAFEYSDEKSKSIRTHLKLSYKSVSSEKLASIKKKIRKESDKEDRRSLFRTMAVLALLSILLVGSTTYYFYYLQEKNSALYAKQELQRKNARKDAIASSQKDVNYFLANGKHYLGKSDYNRAKQLYTKAFELEPEDHDVLRGLTAAYIYDCQFNNIGCQSAKRLLNLYYDTYGETDDYRELQELMSSNN